ncbi:MAG: nucleoid-associated protein [Flavobacteriales bacterium]|nr:nucleoid-associated protein [Flavobacteriales bacterium]MCX7767723.1 nucleoid-associated protein [Flavobacteriales bacterium]MDW8409382.1 nucleoid-associated protein [Flavobacteriales bacterium]
MLIDLTKAEIASLIIHRVGSSYLGEELVLSEKETPVHDEELAGALYHFFLKPLDTRALYQFQKDKGRTVLEAARSVFASSKQFYKVSHTLAKYLYHVSSHPKIKSGDLYVVHYQGVRVGDEEVEGLGIFKTEHRDRFVTLQEKPQTISLSLAEGILLHKLDKGCLVLNVPSDNDTLFSLCVDKSNPLNDAAFWREEFLGLERVPDERYISESFQEMVKIFTENARLGDVPLEPARKAAILSRSADFFKEAPVLDNALFEQNVLQEPAIIEEFRDFRRSYEEAFRLPPADGVEIPLESRKSAQRKFKSVIKLDKNFHIYIHGPEHLIERGFDESRGLHYYKLYFETEQ